MKADDKDNFNEPLGRRRRTHTSGKPSVELSLIGYQMLQHLSDAEMDEKPSALECADSAESVFTVVIPTHNRPHALRSCLESLVAQRYPRACFDVIVVEDGSGGTAAPVVAEFSDRLRLSLLRQARAGPAAARNWGAMNARGRYVAFTDDDCLAEPDWLFALESAFHDHPSGALLGGHIVNPFTENIYAEVGELIPNVLLKRYHPEPGGVYFFRTGNLALRRDEFGASGGFDPNFETAEDREFCDRWLHRGGALIQVPGAIVAHTGPPLGLREFLHTHYRYGRGAYRFHHIRRHRGSGRLRFQLMLFYLFVFQACLASRRSVARKVVLVVLWQVCNTLGFLTEFLHERARPIEGGSVP